MSPVLGDLLWALAVLGFLGLCFVGVRLLGRRVGISPELSRKLVHMAMAVAVLPFPWLFTYRATVVIIGALATAGLLAVRLLAPKGEDDLGGVLYRVGRLRSVGELVYPPAVVATYLIAPSPEFYVIPILVLGFADSMAALVGTGYAKRQLAAQRESPKSLEGAVAFFFAAFVCVVSPLLLLTSMEGPVVLLVTVLTAAIATLLELVSSFGLDNFLIPFFIAVFLHRLTTLERGSLLLGFALLLVYLGVAAWFLRGRHITTLGVVEALLMIFLTTLLGGFYWIAGPLVLAFTYSVWPGLTPRERERPLNYHDVESNLIPGLLLVVAGSLAGMPPAAYWVYATYFACLTAKNYYLRLYHYHPGLLYRAPVAFLRGGLLQLAPASAMYRAAFGAFPGPGLLALAGAAVLAELLFSNLAVRRGNFPEISLRLGWLCSLSSAAFAAAPLLALI